ncbi:DUF916 and DUF3324 domain-containing protein [Enterococcus sp. LJL98]
MKKKILVLTIFVIGLISSYTPTAFASEFNFSVITETPASQIDKEKTYFDVQLKPNQEESLSVLLRNDTDKEVQVGISISRATTNKNVIVEYGPNEIPKDESLAYDLADYLEGPEKVVLKPKSQEHIAFKAKMPSDSFDGVIAGGLTFKEINEEKTEDKESGMTIKNEYSYVVAVLMRQTLDEVAPNLTLKKVFPDQINARNAIISEVQNDQMTYINQVVVETQITKKGSEEVLYESKKEKLQIAPNSTFEFPTSLEGKRLEAGDYHLSMTVYGNRNDNGEYTRVSEVEGEKTEMTFNNLWEFEEDFTIEGEVAKKLNETDVSIEEEDNFLLYVVIGLLFLIVVLLLIIFLVWRRRKNEEEKDEQDGK